MFLILEYFAWLQFDIKVSIKTIFIFSLGDGGDLDRFGQGDESSLHVGLPDKGVIVCIHSWVEFKKILVILCCILSNAFYQEKGHPMQN